MLFKKKVYKIKNIALLCAIITFLITLRYDFIGKSAAIPLNNNLSGEIACADTTQSVTIKISLFFNADLDNSDLVDGKDLALLVYYFGKTESEYGSNNFNINPDLNGDKIVDGEDLFILASHFGLKK